MKTCTNCGNALNDHARFCPECGTVQDTNTLTSSKKTCNNCGAELNEHSKFCLECGTPVTQNANTVPQGGKEQRADSLNTNNKTCLNCGAGLNDHSKFCLECGTPVIQNAVSVSSTESIGQQHPKKSKIAFVVIPVVICIAVIGLIIAKQNGLLGSSEDKPAINTDTGKTAVTTVPDASVTTFTATTTTAETTTMPTTTTKPATTTTVATTAVKIAQHYANELIWKSKTELIDDLFKGDYQVEKSDDEDGMYGLSYLTNQSLYKNIYVGELDYDDSCVGWIYVKKGGYLDKAVYVGMSYNDLESMTSSFTGLCKDGTSLSRYYATMEVSGVRWDVYFILSENDQKEVNKRIAAKAKKMGVDYTLGITVDVSDLNPISSYATWDNGIR